MKSTFRILHLEDSPEDCELVEQMLVADGINCEIIRCENRENFARSLEKENFDLIFADCTVPQFNGLHALEMARELAPEVPFIFVSGTIEEDSAIESLRRGATDYVLKGRLSRLVPAVRRAMAEAKEKAKSLEMEQRLRHSQRLEAVGTLAGGVAHDFNNILTIIKGYTSLLPTQCEEPARVREIAGIIDRASLRGSELVNQLLAFARKTEGSFAYTALNERIQEVVAMLRPALPQNIAFELHLEENLPEIYADAGQVERVLINLATNARDAMPEGGKIIFSTSKVPGDEAPAHSGNEAKEYVCLRVTDTGCGMEQETLQRVFEPFFTTKVRGKGTGLGMPVVYGLMQSQHGLIDVRSEVGKGTTVSLFFPATTGTVSPEIERAPDAMPSVRGEETIMLVDDEPELRNLLELILTTHGYKVLSAQNAETAMQMLPRLPEKLHVLLSDVGLPTVDGFELIRRARKIQPGLKAILCSGYSDEDLKSRMAEEGIDGFVSKPYKTSDLLLTVRTILDREK